MLLLLAAFALSLGVIQLLRPLAVTYAHYRRAKQIGLPIKLIPFPPGLFSFFAFQILRRLGLLEPGTKLHQLLTMGRPDSYALHREMGDVFVTVSPAGLTLIVADPKVAAFVNGKQVEFPKPPNTGAIINIYGRNVINADGRTWRFHRKVTGPVFSERIHSVVWQQGMRQARSMMNSWGKGDSVRVHAIGEDTLRLGLNVITGSAYGTPIEWDGSPPCAVQTRLSFREAMDSVTVHLMPIFLTPHWLLRLAPIQSHWGRAWEAYTAFEGYMRGMLDRTRARRDAGEAMEDSLVSVLLNAQDHVDEKEERSMTGQEVMGNMFIMLFAGHETTANTLHYAFLLLALNPEVQEMVLEEVSRLYGHAAMEGRTQIEYELDYKHAHWCLAVMYETLRVYSPTGMTNKWTASDQPITFQNRGYVIPKHTRISINGTGIHFNPSVWGDDALEWKPSRWMVDHNDGGMFTPLSSRPPSPLRAASSRPQTPLTPLAPGSNRLRVPNADQPSPLSRASSSSPTPLSPMPGILRPAKGTYLPFSEGARMCSGKKFAAVEFVAVMMTVLREHRMDLADGWSRERVRSVLAGRKPGAITMQPPEMIPLQFVRRW